MVPPSAQNYQGDVEQQCEEYGLLPPPGEAKLREALIHLGQQLIENECVSLKRPAGLSHSDVIKLLE